MPLYFSVSSIITWQTNLKRTVSVSELQHFRSQVTGFTQCLLCLFVLSWKTIYNNCVQYFLHGRKKMKVLTVCYVKRFYIATFVLCYVENDIQTFHGAIKHYYSVKHDRQ